MACTNCESDEILYHAKIHPEQYTDSLKDGQLHQLHQSLLHICTVAVETLADSTAFPKEWLMKHRWGKGKQDNKLPNGAKIIFLTVGGRTSAVVPSVQKKTGPVAGDVQSPTKTAEDDVTSNGVKKDEASDDEDGRSGSKNARASKAAGTKAKASKSTGRVPSKKASAQETLASANPAGWSKRKPEDHVDNDGASRKVGKGTESVDTSGRRRSARVSGKGT